MNKHHRKSQISFLLTLTIIIIGIIFIPLLTQLEVNFSLPNIADALPASSGATASAPNTSLPTELADNKLIEVDPCNLSGNRVANSVVDIGFDSPQINREYLSYVNGYSQVVYVSADEIILQDDATEQVTSSNRYCQDEAKVSGVESSQLDEGHVIADSLGGVSNAYNITPQDSTLNRHGTQADIEELIRENGGATDFKATITYPNHQTQTPDSYTLSFTLGTKEYTYTFKNEDSENLY